MFVVVERAVRGDGDRALAMSGAKPQHGDAIVAMTTNAVVSAVVIEVIFIVLRMASDLRSDRKVTSRWLVCGFGFFVHSLV